MPFTPFHMGPGLAVKAVGRRHFSLMVFGFNQIAMDIEPLVHMIRGDDVLHGFSHTYLGATFIAIVSIFAGRPVCQHLLKRWILDGDEQASQWLRGPQIISWPAAVTGAFVGSYSHVFLDSIMHADMRPLAPFSNANALLHVIPVGTLHLFCIASGIVGGIVVLLISFFQRKNFQ